MDNLVVENGFLITPEQERLTKIWLQAGRILYIGDKLPTSISSDSSVETFKSIDASGCYVTPGLIDLQMNGGPACDFWQDLSAPGADQNIRAIREELLSHGVTAFLPTLITAEIKHLVKNIAALKAQGVSRQIVFSDSSQKSVAGSDVLSRMVGIHLEGPCLSPARPGVHPPEWIVPFDCSAVNALINDDSVALFTAACEGNPQGDAIALLKTHGITVALGHSNATFDEANLAFDQGVRLMTHTFNALPPLHHRKLGAVGAALLNKSVTCCLIADGLHLDKAACALIFALKGVDKTVLVTDRAAIGTSGGDLVGSSITLDQAVQNMVKWEICSFAEAIKMATLNAARAIGIDQTIGSLEVGKAADLVLFNKTSLKVEKVILGGRI